MTKTNTTLAAAEIAAKVPDMAQDCAVNNETLIKGMLDELVAADRRQQQALASEPTSPKGFSL